MSQESRKSELSSIKDISLDGGRILFETNINRDIIAIQLGDATLSVPQEQFEKIDRLAEGTRITIEDFSIHQINMKNRFGKDVDLDRITQDQSKLLITREVNGVKTGWSIPRRFSDGAIISQLQLNQDASSQIKFEILLFEVQNSNLKPIEVVPPTSNSIILHGTQILGHVKDACDMQINAFSKGTLQDWQFAFPPTKRTTINQLTLKNLGIPTEEVTSNWSYGPENEELPSNFRSSESFPTLLAFLAANSELCKQVVNGEFSVVSTNFKQEGNILKMLNPDVTLSGINFTFLSGTPEDRLHVHEDLPTFKTMLTRVQNSLDNAPQVLEQIVGKPVKAANWWELVSEKLQSVDVIFYRTFSFDPTLPETIGNTLVVQIPHPIPTVRLSKEESRLLISNIIDHPVKLEEKVILLPGASEDGLFEQRAKEVFSIAQKRDDVIVLLPLSPTDKRLEGIDIPKNAFPIGFREDWMDILPGADTTIIRGSWGEILDVVAAGAVPVISSPGTVPESGDPGYIQFLSEVSGERAVNVSLFLQELQNKGVKADVINGLIADIADKTTDGKIAAAIDFALQDEVMSEINEALSDIETHGIHWMVELHELLRKITPMEFRSNLDIIHSMIWGNNES